MDLDVTDQLLIRYSSHTGANMGVCQLLTDLKKAHDSVRGEVMYNILIALGIPMKLTHSKEHSPS
jgi:hypothetical protein